MNPVHRWCGDADCRDAGKIAEGRRELCRDRVLKVTKSVYEEWEADRYRVWKGRQLVGISRSAAAGDREDFTWASFARQSDRHMDVVTGSVVKLDEHRRGARFEPLG